MDLVYGFHITDAQFINFLHKKPCFVYGFICNSAIVSFFFIFPVSTHVNEDDFFPHEYLAFFFY